MMNCIYYVLSHVARIINYSSSNDSFRYIDYMKRDENPLVVLVPALLASSPRVKGS